MSVAHDLEREGIRTRDGARWTCRAIVRMVKSPPTRATAAGCAFRWRRCSQ
ncbi:hypothetical protein C4B68_36745 [Streptomyces dengpaensis]|uniref:Recombinase domain-containing protein n=1 Tax=Streptomyces dengpaensis TaxID=2049881 RepID=A0ABM6T098_9ACTN|nr:hypothetical protein C4B68_36745 [Streptomyces dengpaensis]